LWVPLLLITVSALWKSRRTAPTATAAKSHTTRRRKLTLGLGLAVMSSLLDTWLLSGIYEFEWTYRQIFSIELGRGSVTILYGLENNTCWYFQHASECRLHTSDDFSMDWTIPHTAECMQSSIGPWSEIVIPLWFVFILAAAPMLRAYRRSRRPPPGHCPQCAYNLTG